MGLFRIQILINLLVLVTIASSETVYITNLPVYKALAPCASSAISYIVQGLTVSKCPALVTQLQSCACTKDQNSAAVGASIKSSVLYSCGSTATEDVASAADAFSAYCNQATAVAVPTPTSGAISRYITDLSAFSDLAPCAQTALSYSVQGLTNSKCPSGASILQSCACTKGQISLSISEALSTAVSYTCGSTHTADIASAQAIFAGYCGLGNGTSDFPTPSPLAGKMTYYITDLPTYSSLAKCARTAVSYPVQSQSLHDCPSNPMSLASCICVKDQNSDAASSSIKYSVSYLCGSTASADIASALGVLDYYCSAAKGLLTPVGVTASVTTGANGGTAKTTSKTAGATATNTGSSSDPAPTITDGTISTGSTKSVPVGAIAGAIGGAAIFIIAMVVAGCRYRHRNRYRPPPDVNVPLPQPAPPGYEKSELDSTALKPPPPVVTRKPTPTVIQNPLNPVIQPNVAELSPMLGHNNPRPGPGPVSPMSGVVELGHDPRRHEAEGSTQHPVEMGGTSANMRGPGPWYEMHAP